MSLVAPLSDRARALWLQYAAKYPDTAAFFGGHLATYADVRRCRDEKATYVQKMQAQGFRVGASTSALALLDAVLADAPAGDGGDGG